MVDITYVLTTQYKLVKNNRYGQPNKEVLEKLKVSTIYRTDLNGSIMIKISKYKNICSLKR